MSEAVTEFFTAWAMEDDKAREAQLERILGETMFYADPRTEAPLTTREAVIAYVGQFSKMAPGMPVGVIEQTRTLDFVRATVAFGAGDQAQMGQYCVDLDGAGRITRMIGFKGRGETT